MLSILVTRFMHFVSNNLLILPPINIENLSFAKWAMSIMEIVACSLHRVASSIKVISRDAYHMKRMD
jgi:hypothetical protein